jgi:hypothetical protein
LKIKYVSLFFEGCENLKDILLEPAENKEDLI